MENEKIIIDIGNVWESEDSLAPIYWEGYSVLFNDGSQLIIDSLSEIKNYRKATEEEVKEFYRSLNFLFKGDEVVIIKGRKIPVGEHKVIKGFSQFLVPNTYGHRYTHYVHFTDGTKTDIHNVKNVKTNDSLIKSMNRPNIAIKFENGINLSGNI